MHLVVDDDGAGFDANRLTGATLGVIGMRQRAEQLGGRAIIGRRAGGGTRVEVVLPLETPRICDCQRGNIGRMT